MENFTKTDKASVIQTACELAKIFRKNAYAPYSNYKVGACAVAIHPEFGTALYFGGSNVENASYGLTMCAERAAIFNAVSAGFKDIVCIAIATEDGGVSCGACRQVEYEFNPDMLIISVDAKDNRIQYYVSDLLPKAFGPRNLKKKKLASIRQEDWIAGYKEWYNRDEYSTFDSEPE